MTRRLAALLLLAAASARADGPPTDWEYTVTYRGQPAAGVKVGLVELGHGPTFDRPAGTTRFATTDAKGQFRLPRQDRGPNALARVLGRDRAGRGAYGTLYGTEKYPPTLELRDAAVLTGRVTDAGGKPVPGLKLTPVALGIEHFARYDSQMPGFVDTPDWFWQGYAPKTAADGGATLAGVPDGLPVAVRFEAPGFGTGRVWLLPGRPVAVRLQPAGAVRLRFPAPPGARPGDVRVTLTRKADGSYLEAKAEGTAKGDAELTLGGLQPGAYDVAFPYPGPAELYPKAVPPVTVRPGETATVAAPLERAARVSATLVDSRTRKGVAGAGLMASVQSAHGHVSVPEAKAGADGKVELTVPAGMVSVTPGAADGYKVVPFRTSPVLGGTSSTEAVPVGPGESRDFGRFALIRTVDLHGTVVDPEGKPVAGATVVGGGTATNFPTQARIVADASGRFVIRGLSPEAGAVGVTAREGHRLTAAPVIADPASPGTEVRVVVSARFAARVRARAVDAAGRPVAGARVDLVHTLTLLLRQGGGVAATERVGLTGPDGRFESDAFQAGDTYAVSFSAPGYRGVTGPEWKSVPGEVHDFGDLRLKRADLAVTGTVTDLGGRPVAGARVFDNADGPRPTSTTTDAAGRFTLPGLFDGPAFVSVKADGFRLASAPAEGGGKPVTVILRRPGDPPAPPPAISDAHRAATAKLTRHLLEQLWAARTDAGDDGRQTLSAMARDDFKTAQRWAEEERARPGGADLSALLDQAGAGRRLADVAREDPDEAVALLKSATGTEGFVALCRLADGLLSDAPEPALRLAEEAVSRARALEPMYRPWALARAGELVFRAGRKDAGRKVIEEAAALAAARGVDEFDGYSRGTVACRVALYDPAAARRLIDPVKDATQFNRWLAQACIRLSETDLPLAKRWLEDFRASNSLSRVTVRQRMAYRLARRSPDEAVALAEGIDNMRFRAATLAGVAARLAAADRARATRLLDAVLDDLAADHAPNGDGAMAALVLLRAKEAGHPDLASIRDRVLAMRPAASEAPLGYNYDPVAQTALALALTDPETARVVLRRALLPEGLKALNAPHARETLIALALVDPAALDREVDRLVAQAAKAKQGFRHGLLENLATLLTEPDQLAAKVTRSVGIYWEAEEE
jgi:protocatechuate 3,4-dioxygenase beta subunit